jgi:hypothetical protein
LKDMETQIVYKEIIKTPGRNLDALIAEKVFSYRRFQRHWQQGAHRGLTEGWLTKDDIKLAGPLPNYSTDIAAAWEVVEKLSTKYFMIETRVFNNQPYQSQCLILKTGKPMPEDDLSDWIVETGDTLPHAICLAALKAVDK